MQEPNRLLRGAFSFPGVCGEGLQCARCERRTSEKQMFCEDKETKQVTKYGEKRQREKRETGKTT